MKTCCRASPRAKESSTLPSRTDTPLRPLRHEGCQSSDREGTDVPAHRPPISLQAHRSLEFAHRYATQYSGDLFPGAKSSRKRGIDEDCARCSDPLPSNSATRSADTDPQLYLKRRSFWFVEPSTVRSNTKAGKISHLYQFYRQKGRTNNGRDMLLSP